MYRLQLYRKTQKFLDHTDAQVVGMSQSPGKIFEAHGFLLCCKFLYVSKAEGFFHDFLGLLQGLWALGLHGFSKYRAAVF